MIKTDRKHQRVLYEERGAGKGRKSSPCCSRQHKHQKPLAVRVAPYSANILFASLANGGPHPRKIKFESQKLGQRRHTRRRKDMLLRAAVLPWRVEGKSRKRRNHACPCKDGTAKEDHGKTTISQDTCDAVPSNTRPASTLRLNDMCS